MNQTIEIDCPEHITHKATLYANGHRYTGVWECPEGVSDSCPHFDKIIEETEDEKGNKARIYTCALDGALTDGWPEGEDNAE